jgi:hypothetical protein
MKLRGMRLADSRGFHYSTTRRGIDIILSLHIQQECINSFVEKKINSLCRKGNYRNNIHLKKENSPIQTR